MKNNNKYKEEEQEKE